MVTLPLLFAALFSFSSPKPAKNAQGDYKAYLKTELNERGNYTLTSLKAYNDEEFRIYHYDDLVIDEISDGAFADTTFTSLMLTNSVTHINDAAFTGCKVQKLYFTGSETEYDALNLNGAYQVSFYSKDEGFINYWNTNVRPTSDANICNISKATYDYLYALYKNLSAEDLAIVDEYQDSTSAKISASMKELIKHFDGSKKSQKKDEWNQTGAITLIIIIAVIGMTSITIFFLLKTKNIIH